jgi:copper chaperone NosL
MQRVFGSPAWRRGAFTLLALGLMSHAYSLPARGADQQSASSQAAPMAARHGLDAQGGMVITAEDRCPVCAMKPAKNIKFASAIELRDGRTFYFCGTGCMIRSWLRPDVYLKTPPSMLKRCVVPDYFSGQAIDGLKAFWIAGSDVIGPMGPALVPLKNQEDAAAFRKRHGGKPAFRLGELDAAKWKALTGKPLVAP